MTTRENSKVTKVAQKTISHFAISAEYRDWVQRFDKKFTGRVNKFSGFCKIVSSSLFDTPGKLLVNVLEAKKEMKGIDHPDDIKRTLRTLANRFFTKDLRIGNEKSTFLQFLLKKTKQNGIQFKDASVEEVVLSSKFEIFLKRGLVVLLKARLVSPLGKFEFDKADVPSYSVMNKVGKKVILVNGNNFWEKEKGKQTRKRGNSVKLKRRSRAGPDQVPQNKGPFFQGIRGAPVNLPSKKMLNAEQRSANPKIVKTAVGKTKHIRQKSHGTQNSKIVRMGDKVSLKRRSQGHSIQLSKVTTGNTAKIKPRGHGSANQKVRKNRSTQQVLKGSKNPTNPNIHDLRVNMFISSFFRNTELIDSMKFILRNQKESKRAQHMVNIVKSMKELKGIYDKKIPTKIQ